MRAAAERYLDTVRHGYALAGVPDRLQISEYPKYADVPIAHTLKLCPNTDFRKKLTLSIVMWTPQIILSVKNPLSVF